jgi:glycosyltransferase involved in cell wall biosynthesis
MTASTDPKVSFIVPCYNLAEFLSDCISSILAQTYEDFEILIMDDCSPDHTPQVAKSFRDPRVRYVRNETNLGNIGNYNKAICLARGKYVWLISADDRLRRPYVLEKYVVVMDDHPEVGYAFCPAVVLQDGEETGVHPSTAPGTRNAIFKGRDFVRRLLEEQCVFASAGMVRKECYERVSFFPSDLPYAGDWYLWCMFAFHYDVAYFAEPMVNRRMHDRNLTKFFMGEAIHVFNANMIDVPWRIKYMAESAGDDPIVRSCEDAIVREYLREIIWKSRDLRMGITFEEFEECLHRHARIHHEELGIRARVLAGLADHYYDLHDAAKASHYYRWAVREHPWMLSALAKYALLHLGKIGVSLREGVAALRRRARRMELKLTRRGASLRPRQLKRICAK